MSVSGDGSERILSAQAASGAVRSLRMDFGLYTEGDLEYKKELCALLIENLAELKQQFFVSLDQDDPGVFRDACHKAKVTLSMLEDEELDQLVVELKKDVEDAREDAAFAARMQRFRDVCASIMTSLANEIHISGSAHSASGSTQH